MRYLCALALCGLAAFVMADDKQTDATKKDEGGVRQIELKDVKVPQAKQDAKVTEPMKITTQDELKKAFGEDGAKAIKVDFTKEQLVLFQWGGSGGDKLTPTIDSKDGKTTVTFTMTPGRTKDLRQHAHLFAIPTGAECKVVQ